MPPKEILPPVVYKSENDLKDNTLIIALDPAQRGKTTLAKLILFLALTINNVWALLWVMDWIEGFLAELRRGGRTTRTVELYGLHLRLWRRNGVDLESASVESILGLIDSWSGFERSYQRFRCWLMRCVLNHLGREDVAKKIPKIRLGDQIGKIKEKLLSREEVEKLVSAANPQDRLLVELLYESGARIGELYNLRVKDVGFDEYSAILTLTGKTGTRLRRVFNSVPDLRRQINDHPERKNPDARLFHYGVDGGSEFNRLTLYERVKRLGERVLQKKIHPHMFRHTRATEDAKYYTDREMMLLNGWRKPNMVSVYTHLNLRDVDEKTLILHGVKPKQEALKPIVNAIKCFNCKEENAPIAVYCSKCGQILGSAIDEKTKELESHAAEMEKRLAQYQNVAVQVQNVAAEALTRLTNLETIVERIKKIDEEKKISP
jgi:integrase